MTDLLLLLTTEEPFVSALQHNYRSCRKLGWLGVQLFGLMTDW